MPLKHDETTGENASKHYRRCSGTQPSPHLRRFVGTIAVHVIREVDGIHAGCRRHLRAPRAGLVNASRRPGWSVAEAVWSDRRRIHRRYPRTPDRYELLKKKFTPSSGMGTAAPDASGASGSS